MNNAFLFVIVFALFLLPYVFKKRFGVLVLAIASGSILNSIWAYDIGLIAKGLGFPDSSITPYLVSILIILAPALIIIFQVQKVHNSFYKFIGSILFSVIALSFIIEPVGRVLLLTNLNSSVYNWFFQSRYMIMGFGLIISLVDIFFTKKPTKDIEKKH